MHLNKCDFSDSEPLKALDLAALCFVHNTSILFVSVLLDHIGRKATKVLSKDLMQCNSE